MGGCIGGDDESGHNAGRQPRTTFENPRLRIEIQAAQEKHDAGGNGDLEFGEELENFWRNHSDEDSACCAASGKRKDKTL